MYHERRYVEELVGIRLGIALGKVVVWGRLEAFGHVATKRCVPHVRDDGRGHGIQPRAFCCTPILQRVPPETYKRQIL